MAASSSLYSGTFSELPLLLAEISCVPASGLLRYSKNMLEDPKVLLSTLFIFWLGDFGIFVGWWCWLFVCFMRGKNISEKLEGKLVRNTYMLPSGVTSKLGARTLENPLWRPSCGGLHP